MQTLAELRSRFAQAGVVQWIGVRPARDAPMTVLDVVEAVVGRGLAGDRFAARHSDRRAVTFIQAEHLAALAGLLHRDRVAPASVRRNIVVAGLNLLALKDVRFQIGAATFEMTGLCHPCSKMEKALGPGGYNAMRGHGGITARVVAGGSLRCGDAVLPLAQ